MWRTGYYYNPGTQPISAIPWSKYTHLIQYTAKPKSDFTLDMSAYSITGNSITDFVNGAHAQGVKALLGLTQDSDASILTSCTDPANIATFVANIVSTLTTNGYDGIDIDWESGVSTAQYQDLITKLRVALPAAIITTFCILSTRTAIIGVQSGIDQINCGNYDQDVHLYSGSNGTESWFNSAILSDGHGNSDHQSATGNLFYFLASGMTAAKIGIAMPFYGRLTQGVPSTATPKQPFATGDAVSNVRTAYNYNDLVGITAWTRGVHQWHPTYLAPYIDDRIGNAFISYTDARQLRAVVDFIIANSLGGIAVYTIDAEYTSGASGDAKYPLSSSLVAEASATGLVRANAANFLKVSSTKFLKTT